MPIKINVLIVAFCVPFYACEKNTHSTPSSSSTTIVTQKNTLGTIKTVTNFDKKNSSEQAVIIDEIKKGDGTEVKEGMVLTVNYTGSFLEGTVFDSTKKRGRPFSFTKGKGTVIKGWEQGVKGMRVGGKRKIQVPAELAYGEKGISNLIPPASTLVFEIELLSATAAK